MSSYDNHKVTFGLLLKDNKPDIVPKGLKHKPDLRRRGSVRHPKITSRHLRFLLLKLFFTVYKSNQKFNIKNQKSNFLVNIVHLNATVGPEDSFFLVFLD